MKNYVEIKLKKNLRRDILRGHPWIYLDAFSQKPGQSSTATCKVYDHKSQFLAWGYFDPHNPIAIRVLTTDPEKKITSNLLEKKFSKAHSLRKSIINDTTNGFRLFNGEGDLLPGLICDIYSDIAVIQYDGKGPAEFWSQFNISDWLVKNINCKTIVNKSRNHEPQIIHGTLNSEEVLFKENNVFFLANIIKGQKTGFFFDQRENRNYIKQISKNKTVLNLFSYTGGFSIYAGVGGASQVTSVDISYGALESATKSWAANELEPQKHQNICQDVFKFLTESNEKWDYILVDPPSMASSEKQKKAAIKKYVETFSAAAKNVKPDGSIFFSSCSSHITFNDFFEIIEESLSKCRKTGQIIRVSGQGPDHPYPHVFPEFRYLKFVHIQL